MLTYFGLKQSVTKSLKAREAKTSQGKSEVESERNQKETVVAHGTFQPRPQGFSLEKWVGKSLGRRLKNKCEFISDYNSTENAPQKVTEFMVPLRIKVNEEFLT